MNKEDILKKSRDENEGKSDEREIQISSSAARIGMTVGGILSLIIVVFSKIVDVPLVGLSALTIYFCMFGSRHLYYFKYTKDKLMLIMGLIGSIGGLAYFIGMIVLGLQQ